MELLQLCTGEGSTCVIHWAHVARQFVHGLPMLFFFELWLCLCVCLYCIVVYTTEDHRSVVETFGVNKSPFVNLGASVKHN